jgi:hypothetical protein
VDHDVVAGGQCCGDLLVEGRHQSVMVSLEELYGDRDVHPAVADGILELVSGHAGGRRADGQDRTRRPLRTGGTDRAVAGSSSQGRHDAAGTDDQGGSAVGAWVAQRASDFVHVLLVDCVDNERGEARILSSVGPQFGEQVAVVGGQVDGADLGASGELLGEHAAEVGLVHRGGGVPGHHGVAV